MDGVVLVASFTQMDTPMVRMNFDPSIGIAEVSETGAILGQNMPNPFDNNSTINFELTNTSDVQFEFVDMTGKIVKNYGLRHASKWTSQYSS